MAIGRQGAEEWPSPPDMAWRRSSGRPVTDLVLRLAGVGEPLSKGVGVHGATDEAGVAGGFGEGTVLDRLAASVEAKRPEL